VETTSAYFTRRARQERAKAARAGSAEARKAHLELALRLVKMATGPALWAWPEYLSRGGAVSADHAAAALTGMGQALAGAFPLSRSGGFEHLLRAVDARDRPSLTR
jgi:hypothetical protein